MDFHYLLRMGKRVFSLHFSFNVYHVVDCLRGEIVPLVTHSVPALSHFLRKGEPRPFTHLFATFSLKSIHFNQAGLILRDRSEAFCDPR